MKKTTAITLIFLIMLFCSVTNALATIPYKILHKEKMLDIKASYDIEVPLVKDASGKERLPNESELKEISLIIKNQEKNTQRVFVLFYLPGMKLNAGAFATAHHNPNLEVKILDFMLSGTKYEKFLKK